jgi:hypothetical protein
MKSDKQTAELFIEMVKAAWIADTDPEVLVKQLAIHRIETDIEIIKEMYEEFYLQYLGCNSYESLSPSQAVH